MIDDSTIQEIKDRLDIVEVVGDFVSLKKSGSSYKALSPFSSEKTPSFFVSPSKQIFKCFSTGKGGDAIQFLKEVESLSYIEAIKYLGEKYGIEINETDNDYNINNDKESLLINSLVQKVRNNSIDEVILATSSTVEGQTTAFYIQDKLKDFNVKISRLAQGIPVGGEIENLDDGTLVSAFKNRKEISD